MEKKNLLSRRQVKSVDFPSTSQSIKDDFPKRKVSAPLQTKRFNFLLSHVDLDTSYNLKTSSIGQIQSNMAKMSNKKADVNEKQFSPIEKGILRRFMQSQDIFECYLCSILRRCNWLVLIQLQDGEKSSNFLDVSKTLH